MCDACLSVLWGFVFLVFFNENCITFILPVLDFTHSDALSLLTAQYQGRSGRWMTWLIQVLFILKWNLHVMKYQVFMKKLLVSSTFILQKIRKCQNELASRHHDLILSYSAL